MVGEAEGAGLRLAGGGGWRGSDSAVAAFAFLEVEEGFEEAGALEIGPESFRDKNFGVGDLPEEKIADAHFAAGADEKIGIGQVGGVEMLGEVFLGDGSGGVAVAARLGGTGGEDSVHGVDNFGAATVIEGDGEHHARVFCRGFNGFARVLLDAVGKFIGAAEETHADIVFLEERHLLAKVFAEELHEEFDFGFGAAPVFDREGVESERFDVQTGAGFDGDAGGTGAIAVTGNPGKMALLSPAAVAVHDDGDMARETGNIEFLEEAGLFGSDGAEGFQLGAGVRHDGFRNESSLWRKVNIRIAGMQL